MKAYKLTDEKGQTFEGCQWGKNVTHTATEEGNELCTNQVIHVYSDPYLAVFANPVHADFNLKTAILWEIECSEPLNRDALKMGVKTCTTLRQIPKPILSGEQRIEIAIRCVKMVYKNEAWNLWADNWLSGEDRTSLAAEAARAADLAADKAYFGYAADAAYLAAGAADLAADKAYFGYAADAAYLAAEAADLAADGKNLDIIKLIGAALKARVPEQM